MVSAMRRAGVGDRLGERLASALPSSRSVAADFLGEALRDLSSRAVIICCRSRGELGELVVHVLGLEIEAGGEPVAGRRDGGGGVVAGGFQPLEQRRAALAASASIMESPAWPSASVMCSPFSVSERVTRCATSLTLSATRSPTEVMSCDRSRCTLEIALRTCSAWPTSVSRWLRKLAEQFADAHLVVVIGALERGDLVVHQRFEFGGAGQRAFDAVAHGGDFAADGLADGDDLTHARRFPAARAAWRLPPWISATSRMSWERRNIWAST